MRLSASTWEEDKISDGGYSVWELCVAALVLFWSACGLARAVM